MSTNTLNADADLAGHDVGAPRRDKYLRGLNCDLGGLAFLLPFMRYRIQSFSVEQKGGGSTEMPQMALCILH